MCRLQVPCVGNKGSSSRGGRVSVNVKGGGEDDAQGSGGSTLRVGGSDVMEKNTIEVIWGGGVRRASNIWDNKPSVAKWNGRTTEETNRSQSWKYVGKKH